MITLVSIGKLKHMRQTFFWRINEPKWLLNHSNRSKSLSKLRNVQEMTDDSQNVSFSPLVRSSSVRTAPSSEHIMDKLSSNIICMDRVLSRKIIAS